MKNIAGWQVDLLRDPVNSFRRWIETMNCQAKFLDCLKVERNIISHSEGTDYAAGAE